MANGKSLALGVLFGAAVGAAATLLTTPTSGKDLRTKVKDQSIEWKELLENLKQDGLRLKNQIAATSKEGVSLMKDLTHEMKNSIVEWKESVEPHQQNIHQYLEQIESSLKDLEEKVNAGKNKEE
ncbi:YtxH domain-containing protein [Ornithinibacillus scapharcae]|uniref:YtxH domain-containing protein n=1 Tax=Ornithinibacillus scapharcae TaxID=1147159 RepID=UPI000225B7A7|nr:YtxH domain-containing protein [Ornithinibacillus scapharcae]